MGGRRPWSFHVMALANGTADAEVAASRELTTLLTDPESELTGWQRDCSYRLVSRADVEAVVRTTHAEALELRRREEEEQAEAALSSADGGVEKAATEPPSLPETAPDQGEAAAKNEEVVMTPALLALAFQRMVETDKQDFLAHQLSKGAPGIGTNGDNVGGGVGESGASVEGPSSQKSGARGDADPHKATEGEEVQDSPLSGAAASSSIAGDECNRHEAVPAVGVAPARIYLLKDYPMSLQEIDALLRLGETGHGAQVDDNPEMLPLLPLIDGVLLLADPPDPVAARNRLKAAVSSVTRSKSNITAKVAEQADTDTSFVGPPEKDFVFHTSNETVRGFFEAARVGGLEWSDFVFTSIRCTSSSVESNNAVKTPGNLMKDLLSSVETLAAQKFAFKDWVSSTKFCSIPSYTPTMEYPTPDVDNDPLGASYCSVLDGVFTASISVSAVLFAIVEAVVAAPELASPPSAVDARALHRNNQDPQSEEFIEHGDGAAIRIAYARTCHDALQAEGSPCYLAGGRHRLEDVERSMWSCSDLPGVGNKGRKAMPRSPGLSAPERNVRNTEFATFLTSSRLTCSQVHLTRQLLQLEELLGSSWRGKLQPRSYVETLTRAILPQRISQVLQENAPRVFTTYYPPTDSLLLACLAETAPGRVESSSWTAREHVRHRPAFKHWHKEDLPPDDFLTPRTEAAAGACIPLSSAQLDLVSDQTWTVYPADHSVVRLYQTARGHVWLSVYQHGYDDPDVFGFRSTRRTEGGGGIEPQSENPEDSEDQNSTKSAFIPTSLGHLVQFVGSFRDDSYIHISEGRRQLPKKPDGFSTITVSNSFPSGLVISACSDGSIVQRYVRCPHVGNKSPEGESRAEDDPVVDTTQEGLPADNTFAGDDKEVEESDSVAVDDSDDLAVSEAGPNTDGLDEENEIESEVSDICGGGNEEKYRVIYGKGSVLRVLNNGRKEILLASGTVRVLQEGKSSQSHRDACETINSDDEQLPPPRTTLTVDPETNAVVERRPDGVITVTYTDGAHVTYHVDGTRILMNAGHSHVVVKKGGFADVCIDVDVNVTAQRHAAGERVAVTKGGLRTRSIVNVYEGTRIEVSYNTKVTAQVNGRVTTRKPNGFVIVAKESGRVEYSARKAPDGSSILDYKEDGDRDVTNHNGVYYFDCQRGLFDLCDSEQNQFHVDLGDGSVPTVSVDLAGVVSDAEVTRYEVDPIPAKAVINNPIQPHLFILNGDGTGLEVLRPGDIADYVAEAISRNQQEELPNYPANTSGSQLHVLLHSLRAPGEISQQQPPLFHDAKLHKEMERLLRPVATAGKYLPDYFAELQRIPEQQQQFTVVRRVQQIQPLSTDELLEMHTAWRKWESWQEEREANKERYKIVDPREAEVIAQEAAMQKKVMAAYKAARARKKMARQKAKEMKAKAASKELSAGIHMETVQEGEEPQAGEEDEEGGSDDDELDQFGSDLSDDDGCGDVDTEVDDPMELLWTAFSQADTEARGLLTIAQTRLGVVNVLGAGVTTSELTEALVRFKIPHPFNVSFDVFADLVGFFRSGDDVSDLDASEAEGTSRVPSLMSGDKKLLHKGRQELRKESQRERGAPRVSILAVGSAAEAVRARSPLSAVRASPI